MADSYRQPFTASSALIVSLFIQSFLYGLYLISCYFCASALLIIGSPPRWRRTSEIRWVICLAALFLVANSTLNLALTLLRALDIFGDSPSPVSPQVGSNGVKSMNGWYDEVKVSKWEI